MKINKIRLIGYIAVMVCVVLNTSCLPNFDKINKNYLYPNEEMGQHDGMLSSAFLPNLQKHVIPVPTFSDNTDLVNAYQVSVNLAGDSWAGYLSPNENKWNSGQNSTTYFFMIGWSNLTYDYAITKIFAPWIQIKKINLTETDPNKETFALAQIAKIMGLHRSTDMFGPIPYSKVGSGSFKVEYDSQESVYRSFFTELDEAITVLSDFSAKENEKVPFALDVVYEGDVKKWIRLANSLMLRLAIRVRFVDEALAKTYAEKAVSNPFGVIETIDQIAKMRAGSNLQMRNPLKVINDEYNDTRMGATIQSYLKGYNDPRIGVYFTQNGDKAVRAGVSQSNAYGGCARPNVVSETPVYWIKASEVFFLKAEGALAGFNMGGKTAKDLYEEGIKMSFAENNVAIASYLTSTGIPAAYNDPVNPRLSASAPSNITVAWSESDDVEKKLERIITQKYLAIYPDGQEAWTEWRRTGYPRQIPAAVNVTNAGVVTGNGYKDGVRRKPYPQTEYDQNGENLQKAIQTLLGGADNAATNVWWDKKVKN